jgi:hypothetical protein
MCGERVRRTGEPTPPEGSTRRARRKSGARGCRGARPGAPVGTAATIPVPPTFAHHR